ncbi:hypothetical protein [Longimicrobium sp.]|jgi:hypothetical protein|uniref:hypothetical protein n=1 Tax=Longimicrobium sp. TaxID=2029185 RepID=UPI002F94B857
MRVLLDEQIDRRLKERFGAEFEVRAVLDVGWGSLENGALLRAAEREYDAFVTMDRGIPHQQNIPSLKIGIVVVRAKSNRLEDVSPLVPQIEAALRASKPGTVVYASEGGTA